MTQSALRLVTDPARSPARQAIVDAADEATKIAGEMADLLAQAEAARQAERDTAEAEEALRQAAYDAMLSPSGVLPKAERLRRVAAIHEARGRQADCQAQERAYAVLQPKHAAAQRQRHEAVRAAIREEADKLGAFYRAHGEAAHRAQKALEALATVALYGLDDAHLATHLRAWLTIHPAPTAADPGALTRSIARLEAAAETYSAQWRALPDRLIADPDANVALPEVGQ